MRRDATNNSESGFTLIEVVVAMLVLTIGLVGVVTAITYAVAANNMSRNVTKAKQMIVSALEQTESLRNSGQWNYDQICNCSTTGCIGYPSDFRSVPNTPGTDGIFGTADDPSDGANPGFTRQILVTLLDSTNPNLKKVQVTVQYPGINGSTLTLVGYGYINNDRRSNYLH